MKRGYHVSRSHSIREAKVDLYVEIWEQPVFNWIVAKLYHFWDMKSIPVMRNVEKLHEKLFGGAMGYVPLMARQDIRCWYLTEKNRTTLARVQINQQQYDNIAGKKLLKMEAGWALNDKILAKERVTQIEDFDD